jgi:DNA-binding NtrC family response regulator
LQALADCGWNRTHTAKKLGISRRALIYKLKRLHNDNLLSLEQAERAAPSLASQCDDCSDSGPPTTVDRMLEAAKRGDASDIRSRLVRELERELFSKAMRLSQGNVAEAARWLGVSRPTFYEKLKELEALPAGRPVRAQTLREKRSEAARHKPTQVKETASGSYEQILMNKALAIALINPEKKGENAS